MNPEEHPNQRVLATKPCAWCKTGTVYITTATPKCQRETKRFCSLSCSNAAGGITRPPEHRLKMQEASIKARKAKALASAVAMMGKLPAAEAAKAIHRRAYMSGWTTGKRTGAELERARIYRELKRRQIAESAVQVRTA